jgi:hypothetical protein
MIQQSADAPVTDLLICILAISLNKPQPNQGRQAFTERIQLKLQLLRLKGISLFRELCSSK